MFRYSRSQQQEQTFSPEERLEVLSTKMSRNMEQDALDVASRALQRSREPREIAQYIKKEFDEKYEPNWHCIVGNHFGSYVTHIENNFIYFSQGRTAILLFKTS
ncbi:unnamed protein product [Hymenolepis diminuta]|uniref:Dynein light chain n=1 Tax=Hymenolepis diminuta TaxID=6216 RepID=A0A564ZEF2_HYMDI|nr:unnamed protein product [Hymenolepis diminuta]